MPFYKNDDGHLLAGEFVDGYGYTLSTHTKDDYTYPVDGWYWFVDATVAREALGIRDTTADTP
jgi:hypothetical protein